LETAGQFPTYKKVKAAMYRSRAKRFPPLPLPRTAAAKSAVERLRKDAEQPSTSVTTTT
ncbi:hypothetical protein T08_4873, partial [Trichinella sp. T8]